jgi:hypothetical protein
MAIINNADCGVYFVDSASPAQKVKVINQWTHGSAFLKEPRTIAFTPVLTVA